MQLTTTNGKNIFVNPNYVFKVEPTPNGSLLTFEVERFVLQDLQDVEVSQTPEELTAILKECVEVELLHSNTIYLNRKYIFKILEENDHTAIYVSVKDAIQKYRVYQVLNTVDNLMNQISSAGNGGATGAYLPLSGGSMGGSINMAENAIENVPVLTYIPDQNTGEERYFSLEELNLETLGQALTYSQNSDLPEIVNDFDIPHKAYVDKYKSISVLADLEGGSIVLNCPYTDQNGVSVVVSHISLIFYNTSANRITSLSHLKINTITRSVGLNPTYTITVDTLQPQLGKCQVLFTPMPYQYYEPTGGGPGGGGPIGGFD